MKKTIICFFCILTTNLHASSDATLWLNSMATYNEGVFGVRTVVPDNFVGGTDIIKRVSYAPNKPWGANDKTQYGEYLYSGTAISKDTGCVLMYPYLLFVYDKVVSGFCSPFELCQKQYSAELKEAAGYADGVSIDYNTTGRLTKIGGKEAMEWGNADSVYIADIPVISPCLKRYTHCVGIYMAKSMRVPVFLKLLLTDKGYANLTAILDNVKGSVVYTEKTMLNRQEVITASNNMMRTIKDKILPLRHGEPMP